MLLPLLPGTLPPNACYDNEQERLVAFMGVSSAVIEGGLAFYNYGATLPTPENQGYPWFRTTDGKWYIYAGSWLSPVNYDLGDRRWYAKTLAELVTYDGGDAGAPSVSSGPMWEEDTDFIGRSPMHPGAVFGSNPAKVLALGENYGVASHTNTMLEMPEHTHGVNYSNIQAGTGYPQTGTGSSNDFQFNTDPAGVTAPSPFSVVHPVRGLYCIKWTGRQFWKV